MAKLHVPKKWCDKHEDFYNPLLGCPDCKAEVLQLEAEAEAVADTGCLPCGCPTDSGCNGFHSI